MYMVNMYTYNQNTHTHKIRAIERVQFQHWDVETGRCIGLTYRPASLAQQVNSSIIDRLLSQNEMESGRGRHLTSTSDILIHIQNTHSHTFLHTQPPYICMPLETYSCMCTHTQANLPSVLFLPFLSFTPHFPSFISVLHSHLIDM